MALADIKLSVEYIFFSVELTGNVQREDVEFDTP